jgi:hemerythrin
MVLERRCFVALIGWLPIYSVNIPPIDEQHKSLFDLLNQLHDEIVVKKSDHAAVGDALEALIQYTKTHFALEERFLESMQYPEIARHKAKHEALTRRAMKLQEEFAAGKTAIATEVLNFMLAWLTNHILRSDKQYAAFLKGERIAREED